jgi:hypothetical protein
LYQYLYKKQEKWRIFAAYFFKTKNLNEDEKDFFVVDGDADSTGNRGSGETDSAGRQACHAESETG